MLAVAPAGVGVLSSSLPYCDNSIPVFTNSSTPPTPTLALIQPMRIPASSLTQTNRAVTNASAMSELSQGSSKLEEGASEQGTVSQNTSTCNTPSLVAGPYFAVDAGAFSLGSGCMVNAIEGPKATLGIEFGKRPSAFASAETLKFSRPLVQHPSSILAADLSPTAAEMEAIFATVPIGQPTYKSPTAAQASQSPSASNASSKAYAGTGFRSIYHDMELVRATNNALIIPPPAKRAEQKVILTSGSTQSTQSSQSQAPVSQSSVATGVSTTGSAPTAIPPSQTQPQQSDQPKRHQPPPFIKPLDLSFLNQNKASYSRPIIQPSLSSSAAAAVTKPRAPIHSPRGGPLLSRPSLQMASPRRPPLVAAAAPAASVVPARNGRLSLGGGYSSTNVSAPSASKPVSNEPIVSNECCGSTKASNNNDQRSTPANVPSSKSAPAHRRMSTAAITIAPSSTSSSSSCSATVGTNKQNQYATLRAAAGVASSCSKQPTNSGSATTSSAATVTGVRRASMGVRASHTVVAPRSHTRAHSQHPPVRPVVSGSATKPIPAPATAVNTATACAIATSLTTTTGTPTPSADMADLQRRITMLETQNALLWKLISNEQKEMAQIEICPTSAPNGKASPVTTSTSTTQ